MPSRSQTDVPASTWKLPLTASVLGNQSLKSCVPIRPRGLLLSPPSWPRPSALSPFSSAPSLFLPLLQFFAQIFSRRDLPLFRFAPRHPFAWISLEKKINAQIKNTFGLFCKPSYMVIIQCLSSFLPRFVFSVRKSHQVPTGP